MAPVVNPLQLFGPLRNPLNGGRESTRGQVRPHVAGLPHSGIMPFWAPLIDITGIAITVPTTFDDAVSLASDFWICALLLTPKFAAGVTPGPGTFALQLFRLTTEPSGETVTEALMGKAVNDPNFSSEVADCDLNGVPRSVVGLGMFEQLGPGLTFYNPYNQALRPLGIMIQTNPVVEIAAAYRPFYLRRALHLPADTTLQAHLQFTGAVQALNSLQLVAMGYIPE